MNNELVDFLRNNPNLRFIPTYQDLPDGTEFYQHYREGSGTDLSFNYGKAYYDDSNIRFSVDYVIREAQEWAEKLSDCNKSPFTMCSNAETELIYPSTENWQKAIGDHMIWGYAKIIRCDTQMQMMLYIHAKDRYNFNKNAKDCRTGFPDNANGRFSTIGFAKSFISRGCLTRSVQWTKGEIDSTTIITDCPFIRSKE